MSRRVIDPAMRAEIDRQKLRFTPEDMLPAVQLWREIRRQHANEQAAQRGAA